MKMVEGNDWECLYEVEKLSFESAFDDEVKYELEGRRSLDGSFISKTLLGPGQVIGLVLLGSDTICLSALVVGFHGDGSDKYDWVSFGKFSSMPEKPRICGERCLIFLEGNEWE